MEKFVTIEDCLIYSRFLDVKLSDKTIRNNITKGNIISKKEKNKILIDKYSFIDYLETKINKKGERAYKPTKKIEIPKELNEDLIISIDWFQVTFYAKKKNHFNIAELKALLVELLFIKETDIVFKEKQYNNYQKVLEYNGIMLMYGDETYNHCNLQIKGEGCSLLYKRLLDNNKNWYHFLNKIYNHNGKITRMDIAIDDYTPLFNLEDLEKKIENRHIKTKFKGFKIIKDDKLGKEKGITIYLGSNTSEMYFRFYKKSAEIEAKTEHTSIQEFNRYEIIIKDKKANSVLKKIYNGEKIEHIAVSLINKNFNVYENENLTKYWSEWEKLIMGADRFTFDIPTEKKTVERKKSWLKSQVATVIDEVLLADRKAKELNLLEEDYDTIADILSYSKFKEDDITKERQQEYINKKIEIKEKITIGDIE